MRGSITAQLRARRIAQGLPLKTLAHDLGYTMGWLWQMEHGQGRPSPLILAAWARRLGCEWVLTETVKRPPPERLSA